MEKYLLLIPIFILTNHAFAADFTGISEACVKKLESNVDLSNQLQSIQQKEAEGIYPAIVAKSLRSGLADAASNLGICQGETIYSADIPTALGQIEIQKFDIETKMASGIYTQVTGEALLASEEDARERILQLSRNLKK